MTPEQRREALEVGASIRRESGVHNYVHTEVAANMVERWIAEARADERRNTAERLTGRCDENEKWLRDEVITDDGFAQTIGLSVVRDMRDLAARSARETGGGQP